jgi:two-component system, LuxR family, sensor histidine kinase DctS
MDNHDHQLRRASAQVDRVLEQVVAVTYRCLLRELASGFAHELNQPLAAIAAYAEGAATLLRREPTQTAKAVEIVEEITRQALRAGDAIQRVRGNVRPLPVHRAAADCNALIQEMLPLIEPLAHHHNIRLIVDLSSPLPQVHGDAPRLQGLLLFLFRNAVDAVSDLPAGRRSVTISTSSDATGIELAVTDSGAGVPEEAAREMFRPFFTTKADGTGLGLAVCRTIAVEHGGELRFSNLPEGGARFWARIPRIDIAQRN